MSAPNLNSSSLVATPTVDTAALSGITETTITTNSAASGKCYITLSFTVTNVTALDALITVNKYDGTNNRRVSYQTTVPANATYKPIAKGSFLAEGEILKVTAGTANAFEIRHEYLVCS